MTPMCRWIAYRGRPVYLEDVVTKPCHSLVHQSLHASEAKTSTNGDGFGIGWFGERDEPGLYREIRPAWSDENLRSICAQVKAGLFFAHVRASTGTATTRANCHPFSRAGQLFMHNGQVGCYDVLRRRIENLIPDALYPGRAGTTDSEAIFLLALARGGAVDPVGALATTLAEIKALMQGCSVCEPLRFTAAWSNGRDLHAFRWACDAKAATLYFRETDDALMVVSEPLDDLREQWRIVPQGHVLIAKAGEPVRLAAFAPALETEAA
jgi:glutamine amidotransferase